MLTQSCTQLACVAATRLCCRFRSSLGRSRVLARYNITGISDIATGSKSHLGVPKVSLSFAIDGSGIVFLGKAEAVLEEMVEVIKPTPKPKVEFRLQHGVIPPSC